MLGATCSDTGAELGGINSDLATAGGGDDDDEGGGGGGGIVAACAGGLVMARAAVAAARAAVAAARELMEAEGGGGCSGGGGSTLLLSELCDKDDRVSPRSSEASISENCAIAATTKTKQTALTALMRTDENYSARC